MPRSERIDTFENTAIQPSKNIRGLVISSLIWLLVLGAMLLGGVLRGDSLAALWPYAAVAAVPAVLSMVLAPSTDREWAQIAIMLSWLALAFLACLSAGFFPAVILFLTVPAAAALFARDKIVEGLVLAALSAAGLFYAGRTGLLPDTIANAGQAAWVGPASILGALSFLVSALFGNTGEGRTKPALTLAPSTGEADSWLNAVPGSVLRLSPAGTVLYASDAANKHMVSGNGDLFAQDPQSRLDLISIVQRARDTGYRQSLSVQTVDDSDENAFLKLVATPLEGGDTLVHASDMTEHEARLDALRNANNDARKETEGKTLFFAGVSHELRTPLNAIIGFSDMMRSRLFGPLPGKYAEYADLIHDSGQHMLDLIGDVLDISKVEAGKYDLHYGTFDAADVIRSSVKMTRPAADSGQVELDILINNGDELLIDADRKAVRQILLNLLSNAIKFSPKGGRVVVSAEADKEILYLSVIDNGSGMSPEDLARVGQPYTQAGSAAMVDERGSGLGLSLVKSLTELHKGRFAIKSVVDEGTEVNIYLPLEQMG